MYKWKGVRDKGKGREGKIEEREKRKGKEEGVSEEGRGKRRKIGRCKRKERRGMGEEHQERVQKRKGKGEWSTIMTQTLM